MPKAQRTGAARGPAVPKVTEDYIYYYYAKLVIAPSAGEAGNYRFIMDRYKRLRDGVLQMSRYDRELRALAGTDTCAYCGTKGDLRVEPVVPRASGGTLGLQNSVLTCANCAADKGARDLVEWWLSRSGRDLDNLPRLPIGLYLKMAFEAHQTNFTLGAPCQSLLGLFPARRRGNGLSAG